MKTYLLFDKQVLKSNQEKKSFYKNVYINENIFRLETMDERELVIQDLQPILLRSDRAHAFRLGWIFLGLWDRQPIYAKA